MLCIRRLALTDQRSKRSGLWKQQRAMLIALIVIYFNRHSDGAGSAGKDLYEVRIEPARQEVAVFTA